MRTHLALVSSVIVLSLSAFACGSESEGDDSQPTTATESTGKGGPTDGTSTSPGGSSNPTGQPSGGTPSGGTPSGGTPSGGTPSGGTPSGGTPSGTNTSSSGGTPAGTATAPEAVCAADSIKESENNNTAETANAITLDKSSVFCGALAAGDVDHFSFTLPADATAFAWKYSWKGKGAPKITMTVDGVTVDQNTKPPIKAGKKYDFTVEGATDAVDYVVSLGVGR